MFDEISRTMTPPLVYDFNWGAAVGGRNKPVTVVDVGGGTQPQQYNNHTHTTHECHISHHRLSCVGLGGVLELVLRELPNAQGILYDQPTVIDKAEQATRWTPQPLNDRIQFERGKREAPFFFFLIIFFFLPQSFFFSFFLSFLSFKVSTMTHLIVCNISSSSYSQAAS